MNLRGLGIFRFCATMEASVRQFEKLFGAHFVAISYCTDSLSQQSGIYRETGNFQFLGLFHFRPVSNLNAVEYNGHSQSPSTLNVGGPGAPYTNK
jgi:hypothetical protein